MGRLNEQEDTLLDSLTSNLVCSARSVGAKRYSASMKRSDAFGDEELQEALAVVSVVAVRLTAIFFKVDHLTYGGGFWYTVAR